MGEEIRLTGQTLKILRPFLDNLHAEFAGVELIRSSGLASGTAYPIMLRLERQGLLASRWEEADPAKIGRPRRRYYTITPRGAGLASHAIRDFTAPGTLPIPEVL